MWHTVLISLHAAAGVVAFAAGLRALPHGRLLGTFRWSMVAMAVFLVAAIATELAVTPPGALAVFGALVALAGVMVWRSEAAARADRPSRAYIDHVGFCLVGLFDAFWVVTLLRLGLPGWAVGAVAVGIAVIGHVAVGAAARRSALHAVAA